jgi:hypothetical protein
MLMDQLGYILSEAPVLILMIWFAVRLVQLRRARENRPAFTEEDRRILFDASQNKGLTWHFYSRLALAILTVTTIGLLEIIAFAPFGAAIVTGVLVLTAADIVRRIVLRGQ